MSKTPVQLIIESLYDQGGGVWGSKVPPDFSWIGVPDPEVLHVRANPTPWPYNPMNLAVPSRPGDWSSEVAGYYFIDNASGTDLGRVYGTPAAPRKTLPNPIPVGSRVEISGIYSEVAAGIIPIVAAGNGNSWVANTDGPVFVVTDPVSQGVLAGGKAVLAGTHLIIDGVNSIHRIQFASGNPTYAGNHLTYRNADVDGSVASVEGTAVAMTSDTDGDPKLHHACLYNVSIHDFGPTVPDFDRDYQGLAISDHCEDLYVLDNHIYNMAGSGVAVAVNASNLVPATRVWVAGNLIHNCWQSGVWVKNGVDVVFSQNIIHDIIETPWSPSKAMGGQYFPEYVWYIFNTVYNVRYGFRAASTTGTGNAYMHVIGNIFYDIGLGIPPLNSPWNTCTVQFHGGRFRYFIDNTCVRVMSGLHVSNTTNTNTTEFHGNIIADITHENGHHFYSETTQQSGSVLTNNQYYDDTALRLRNGYSGGSESDLAAWKAATGNSVGDQDGDPLFVDSANNDFSLNFGSPCVNSNTKHPVYDQFLSDYGMDISVDIKELIRPIVSGDWDRGAIEKV